VTGRASFTSPTLVGDAYWVDEGRLLAGPYPGAPTAPEARRKLEGFLDLGITCFVDLTEEEEGPGPTGLHPYSKLLRKVAQKRGIRVTHLRLPIPDVDIPTHWQMRATLGIINTALQAGENVFVHCWGGVGRTGTVIGCLLVELDVPHEMVPTALAGMRKHTARAHRVSPETKAQRDFIAGWTVTPDTLVLDQADIGRLGITPVDTDQGTTSPIPTAEQLAEQLHTDPPITLVGPDTSLCVQAGENEPGQVYMEVLDPEYWQRGPALPAGLVSTIETLGFERTAPAWICTLRGDNAESVRVEAAARILAILAAQDSM